jgi:aryl-alcohol dehydrogenase-like predicted oxidoreductase
MEYRQLGSSDLIVSRICFGCWQLSPKFWGDVPLKPWEEAVKAALDEGVNFIDTADAYGDGYSESSLGDLLTRENLRDRFIIATKFYWNFADGDRKPDTSYDYIIRACEASLKRLKTDRIDLYQIHAFDPLTVPEETAAALHLLKKQGKVRWFGFSNMNPEQMRMYIRYMRPASLQPPYSLMTRDIEREELPFCQSNQIGVIPYSPLYRGLLTGKYGETFDLSDDPRSSNPFFQGEAYREIYAGLEELRPIARDLDITLPQLAVRWILTHPGITSAIVGIKKPEHITGITKAACVQLTRDMWFKVGGIMDRAKREARKHIS